MRDSRALQRLRGSLSIVRRESAPVLAPPFSRCAGGVLVCTNNGAIKVDLFEVRVLGKQLKDLVPNLLHRPSSEPLVNTVPGTEAGREIPPRSACAHKPEDAFHEQTVIHCCPPPITFLTWQQVGDSLPLVVS